jgi:Domain of unknown function (DUF5666)
LDWANAMRFVHASAVLLLFTLFWLSAQSTPEPPIPVIGTVESVSGNIIHVKTGASPITIHSDGQTEIWKGRTFHDLSPLKVGDNITARCRWDGPGKLVALSIWANITNFYGVITSVNADSFEVLTNPNADPQSAYRKEHKVIYVDADTIFEASAKEDLKIGRGVQVVGLDLKDAKVQASRLTVYEGKRPVRMPKDAKVLPVTGRQ